MSKTKVNLPSIIRTMVVEEVARQLSGLDVLVANAIETTIATQFGPTDRDVVSGATSLDGHAVSMSPKANGKPRTRSANGTGSLSEADKRSNRAAYQRLYRAATDLQQETGLPYDECKVAFLATKNKDAARALLLRGSLTVPAGVDPVVVTARPGVEAAPITSVAEISLDY